MATIPANVLVGLSGSGAVPTSWSRETSHDDRFLKGAAAGAEPGTNGGASTHTHTSPSHTHTNNHNHTSNGSIPPASSGSVGYASGATAQAAASHGHVINTASTASATLSGAVATFATSSNDPSYVTTRWIKSDTTVSGVPVSGWAFWNSAAAPSGWSQPAAAQGKYIKGAAAGANGGGTGGSITSHNHTAVAHTHSLAGHTHTSETGTASVGVSRATSGTSSAAAVSNGHTHLLTFGTSSATSGSTTSASSGSASAEVPYVTLGVIQNDNASADMPVGVIVGWVGTRSSIPGSFKICDGTSSTPDLRGKYIKGAAVSGSNFTGLLTSGGAETHDHTDPTTHTHSTAHTHPMSTDSELSGGNVPTGSDVSGIGSHYHSGADSASGGTTSTSTAQTVDSANHEPQYRTVIWVQFIGSIDVTITSPTSGQVFSTPAISVTWTLSSGTQSSAVLYVLAADQTTVLWSVAIAGSTQSYSIPAGIGLHTGRTYYLYVTAINNSSVPGASAALPITTAWDQPAPATGVTLTPIGGV